MKVLGNDLALKIVKELARHPCCAIDVARKLKVHEQKVYYHMRKLEKYGFIYSVSSERRYGMIAKIYNVVSPVISAKLFEKGVEMKESFNIPVPKEVSDFFYPFVDDGKLNAKIIVGDPSPHGEYDEPARDGIHIIGLAAFLGTIVRNLDAPIYKLDVEVKEEELKNNLILVGNPKNNVIIDKIAAHMPVKFDFEKNQIILPNKNTYKDPRIGVILKLSNPFDNSKKLLLICGFRSRGVRAAMLAITKYMDKLLKDLNLNEDSIKVVEGVDKDGDMVVDDVKILE
jgi:DNA-binding transcriptional ArsR family regulator